MDITITLTQRHIDSLCLAYKFSADLNMSDQQLADAKIDFATDRILDFIDENSKSMDVRTATESARIQAISDADNSQKAVKV